MGFGTVRLWMGGVDDVDDMEVGVVIVARSKGQIIRGSKGLADHGSGQVYVHILCDLQHVRSRAALWHSGLYTWANTRKALFRTQRERNSTFLNCVYRKRKQSKLKYSTKIICSSVNRDP